MFDKLQSIDKRIIYTIMLLCLIIPMVKPLGIPLSISPSTQGVYNMVDNLKPGDKVLLALDYSPGGSADVHPQLEVMVDHLMKKGVQAVMVSFWDAGPMFGEQVIPKFDALGKKYGVDYVNLGYVAGGEMGIKKWATDIPGTTPKDFHSNKPISEFPIMKDVKDAKAFKLIIDFSSGTPGGKEWIRQVQTPMNIPMAIGTVTVSVPEYTPFVQSGQLIGMLAGLRGAAEYEVLNKTPGGAVAKMDAQSMGHLLVIAFIVLGNVGYLLTRKQGAK